MPRYYQLITNWTVYVPVKINVNVYLPLTTLLIRQKGLLTYNDVSYFRTFLSRNVCILLKVYIYKHKYLFWHKTHFSLTFRVKVRNMTHYETWARARMYVDLRYIYMSLSLFTTWACIPIIRSRMFPPVGLVMCACIRWPQSISE